MGLGKGDSFWIFSIYVEFLRWIKLDLPISSLCPQKPATPGVPDKEVPCCAGGIGNLGQTHKTPTGPSHDVSLIIGTFLIPIGTYLKITQIDKEKHLNQTSVFKVSKFKMLVFGGPSFGSQLQPQEFRSLLFKKHPSCIRRVTGGIFEVDKNLQYNLCLYKFRPLG